MLDFLRDTARSKALPRLEPRRLPSLSRAVPSLSQAIPSLSQAIPTLSQAVPKVAAWGAPRLFRSASVRPSAPKIGAMAAGPAVLLILAGAAGMYLLDPDRGPERRAQARRYVNDLWARWRVALDRSDTNYRGAADLHREPNDQFAGV
jgi:hypothetical protein